MKTYLAFGSNMGDRRDYIQRAIELVALRVGEVEQVSSIINTKPYGGVEQEDFLNGVMKVDTRLSPKELLIELNKIEFELGRKRTIRWGPRTIDLDIIFYEDWIIDEEDLKIPHIDFQKREFVLLPMMELNKDFVDPRTGKKLKDICIEVLS